jgi:hypothetical protein
MARHQEREQPVSEEEFEGMEERISEHFDRVREELESAIDADDEPGNAE